jgi:hypothetical protein
MVTLQKNFDPNLELQGRALCSSNLTKINSFGLLYCSLSELQETRETALEVSRIFWSIDLSKDIKHAKLFRKLQKKIKIFLSHK